MWGREPKLIRETVLFLEVMLCPEQLAAALGFDGANALLGGTRKLN
jgi:hypothetical protein